MTPDDLHSWSTLAQPWVFEPLVRLNSDGELESVLAEGIEFTGNRQMRLRLREGIQFSDGSPVSFDDVASSLARRQFQVRREGDRILIESTGGAPIELLLSRAFIFRQSGNRFLGTGPYVVAEQESSRILLTRHRPHPGAISHVVLQAYPRAQDAFAHTLKGDANLLPDAEPQQLEFFEGVPRFQIVRLPGTHANAVFLNTFRLSRAERIGLARLFAADEVRRAAFGDECVAPSVRPEIEPLPPGRPLDVMSVTIFERFALAVRRAAGQRGGKIEMNDLQTFVSKSHSGDFDLATGRPFIWPPIVATSVWKTGTNPTNYSNAEVDAALDRRDWKAALSALNADPPMAIVCTPPYVIVVDSRIKAANFSLNALPNWEVVQ